MLISLLNLFKIIFDKTNSKDVGLKANKAQY
jgi:hypothetical protein